MIRISLDTETGGTDPLIHPCLSIGFVVVNCPSLVVIEKGEFFIKARKKDCTEEALKVNHIDIDEHNKKAISRKDALKKFDSIIMKYFGKNEVSIIGQNPKFDIDFIEQIYKKSGKEFLYSKRIVDLVPLWRGLQAIGVAENPSAGLDSILDYLKLPGTKKGRHSALVDAMNVVKVLRFLRKRFGRLEINNRF